MNFLNGGADGVDAVRCSAWLGGVLLTLLLLFVAQQLLSLRLGHGLAVEGDVHLAEALGVKRNLRRLVRVLRRLAGFGLRRLADLIEFRVYGVSRLADGVGYVLLYLFFRHSFDAIYGGGVKPSNEAGERGRHD